MQTRYTTETAQGVRLQCLWSSQDGCKRHSALSEFMDGADPEGDFEDWQWPSVCGKCDEPVPDTAIRRVLPCTLYSTPSGELEPGCMYWNQEFDPQYFWDNHHGPHLSVVAPNGFKWIIDSQASNCKNRNNRHHRCWRWSGDPEMSNVSVYRDDTTCGLAVNNIVVLGSWVGELIEGRFVPSPVLTENKRRLNV